MIGLTKAGEKMFKKVFPEHLAYLDKAFQKLSKHQIEQAVHVLQEVTAIFN